MSIRRPATACPMSYCFLPIEKLLTSYAKLRPGRAKKPPSLLAPLPIRVVPIGGDRYEVLDGFKRLESWREEGLREIPVVIEAEGRPEDHKRIILLANAPLRTSTALDEAEVVASLKEEDGLKESTIARSLSKPTRWVTCRLDLQRHLGRAAKEKLACGSIGPSAAHALCPLSEEDQEAVLAAAERHGLTERASIALFETYRVADEQDRKRLLRDPKGTLEPDPSPTLSPLTTQLERRLERIRRALLDLACFRIPIGIAPPEERRIDAVFRSVLAQLEQTTRAVLSGRAQRKEEDHEGRQQR